MLHAAGIEAHPVLVRTADAGPLAVDVSDLSQFNHFIVWADDGACGLFLDGTVDFCPAGFVPAGDAGSPVLLLRPGAVELVEIPASAWAPGTHERAVRGRLNLDGFLTLDLECTITGNLARRWRSYLTGLGHRKQQAAVERILLPEGLGMHAGDTTIRGLDQWRAPLSVSLVVTSRSPLPRSGDRIFLPRTLSPSPPPTRPDIACGMWFDYRRAASWTESWCIDLPSGLTLAQPDSLSLGGAELRWMRQVRVEDSVLHLERSLRYLLELATPEDVDALDAAVDEILGHDAGYFELVRTQGG